MAEPILSNLCNVPITGAYIVLADVRANLRAGDRWLVATAAVPSCHVYVLGGSLPDESPAAYVGITATLHGTRPADSLRRWAIQTGRLAPRRVGLITLSAHTSPDEVALIEKRIARALNARGVVALNTVTGTPTISRRLGTRADTVAAHGDALAVDVHRLVLKGATAPLTVPATTESETAVRLVLHHGAPMSRDQLLAAVAQVRPRATRTPWASIRRDLSVLEQATAGAPRVAVLHHGRHAYIYPAHLGEQKAREFLESA